MSNYKRMEKMFPAACLAGLRMFFIKAILSVIYIAVFGFTRLLCLFFRGVLKDAGKKNSTWIKASGYEMSGDEWAQQS